MSLTVASSAIHHPIGVFDSGVGGLSVLRQLLRHLPQENMVYLAADSAWAPYGERSPEQIAARSLQIANYLQHHHHIKALAGDAVQLIEPGEPVARQTQSLMQQAWLAANRGGKCRAAVVGYPVKKCRWSRLERSLKRFLWSMSMAVPILAQHHSKNYLLQL